MAPPGLMPTRRHDGYAAARKMWSRSERRDIRCAINSATSREVSPLPKAGAVGLAWQMATYDQLLGHE